MAFAPHGRFGLGDWTYANHPSVFATPADLRAFMNWNISYPFGQVSRVPDTADWVSNDVMGVGSGGGPPSYVGPVLHSTGGVPWLWDENGKKIDYQTALLLYNRSQGTPATQSNAVAPSMASVYDPTSQWFGTPRYDEGGGVGSFDPVLAVSVAGRMANLGEDQATATARAQAAAAKLGTQASLPATTAGSPPNLAAQFHGHVIDAENAANGLVAQFPLSTAMLSNAVTQLKLAGPGIPALVSTVLPELEQQRQAAIQALQQVIAQWTKTWNADLSNIASDPNGAKITADLNAGNDAITAADQAAIKQLTALAASLLQQAGGQQAASQQGAASGTTQTVSAQGGPTEATTTPAGGTATGPTSTGPATGATAPAAAGFSGTAALVLGLGVVGAILASRKGKR